ncbi:GFA family protein [Chondromyces apiculatus]|uniref:CENP-V/GFA domain-containing protein n=1 Tax=Chondromyces apiculatus DSM 436 TaxID=1192034 RepID=A0A017TEM5_9BACT|nr:GFA family protein [Chondromyces apiculatus]EYF07280.1 Hypothetical protein CAP_0759 [Chondromyces apiculatus DSM 436]
MDQHGDTPQPTAPAARTKHRGSCHCGSLRYEALIDVSEGGSRCNCSICTKLNGMWAYVKPDELTLLSSEDTLGTYAWGGKTATRYFCKQCGIHCFGRGHLEEMGGDYASVNMNTLDDLEVSTVKPYFWDGRHDNWHAGSRDTPWPIFTT